MNFIPLGARPVLASLVAAAAVAGCSGSHTTPITQSGLIPGPLSNSVALTVQQPTAGQVVTGDLPIQVSPIGYVLDANYAGSPDLTTLGHYHELLDGSLIDMTPLQGPDTDTVSMAGVTPGPHVLTLVPAENDHMTIASASVDTAFTYAGPFIPLPTPGPSSAAPTIAITSPAAGATVTRPYFNMTVSVGNASICQVCFGKANINGVGHWHIFVDQPVMANMLTMAGDTTQQVPLAGVTPGVHTFWAVFVNDQHMPFMNAPTTMSSVSLNVQ